MRFFSSRTKLHIICISVEIILLFFLIIITSYGCIDSPLDSSLKLSGKYSHRLAVLVPFRERFNELLIFVPYISKFLKKQGIYFEIFVLNQIDDYRFNRASLVNVGFLHTKESFDYIAIHDVDLLPLNDELSYKYPEKFPFHVSAPNLHPKYHYATFVGGILLINSFNKICVLDREQFIIVNGMSNKYWGWGLEDDEFYVRLKEAKLNVTRPQNLKTTKKDSFRHIHTASRKRDTEKCFNQKQITRKRDRETGLNNVIYKITSINSILIDKYPAKILNIELYCDKNLTPWCQCKE